MVIVLNTTTTKQEFHKWMDHLNRVAHASITVYHSFHDEVAFNHQHWWRGTVCH